MARRIHPSNRERCRDERSERPERIDRRFRVALDFEEGVWPARLFVAPTAAQFTPTLEYANPAIVGSGNSRVLAYSTRASLIRRSTDGKQFVSVFYDFSEDVMREDLLDDSTRLRLLGTGVRVDLTERARIALRTFADSTATLEDGLCAR